MLSIFIGKKASLREFADDYIRGLIKDLPANAWRLMDPLTRLGKILADLKIEIPEDIEVLGIKAGKYNLHWLIYYHMFKCFWNDELSFEENVHVNFDWYYPAYSWRHTRDEIESWCKEVGAKIQWFNEEESGFSVMVKKL